VKDNLNELDLKILYYIYNCGPVYIKKLSERLQKDFDTIRMHIKELQDIGYVERVSSRIVDYRVGRKNKVTKHRNHTYYDLTRKGRQLMRSMGNVDINMNLKAPYKR